ncbi:MAG: alpha-L-fucosidase [Planctomycetes bacterium]|nr:alpha-L-fucosidase [Planctomycetota bacterium]
MTESANTTHTDDQAARLRWFKEARFGMFIHWGLYSQLGRWHADVRKASRLARNSIGAIPIPRKDNCGGCHAAAPAHDARPAS